MKRFKTITALCLVALTLMVGGNVWYLCRLYYSIKAQTLHTVTECVRRAEILEIINRLNDMSQDDNDSFIKMTLIIEGEESSSGGYVYPNLLENINRTMTEYFNFVEQSEKRLPERNYVALDSIFIQELNNSGLYPEKACIRPYDAKPSSDAKEMWSVDFTVSRNQPPAFKAYISPLDGHILHQMSGIVCTSMAILLLTGFLIWYLLHKVGKLRTIEQMKDDFTHNMTHELKTPVAVAYAAADSMLRYYDHNDGKRNRQYLNIILQRLSYLSGMIENILSLSMERFKSLKLHKESLLLLPLVRQIAEMIEIKSAKHVNISLSIPEDLSLVADPIHLGNVISNIIDNAVKYSGENVDINIKADTHAIIISDNGIGIDQSHLPYIFDKFYRVMSGDRYEVGGYGLGLFYAKQIVELHGWEIHVTSIPGQGTTFTIKFKNDEKGHDIVSRR